MKPILMSVRDRWATGLMDLSKSHEFRKTEVPTGTTVVVYRSGAAEQRGIVGTFVAGEVTNGIASFLWPRVARPGITLDELKAYGEFAPGCQRQLWSIEATDVRRFWQPLPLSSIGVIKAPQSWQWTTDEMVARLREMNEVPF